MRRNLQRLMVAIAAMMICLGASAIDKVFKKATLSGEVTSVEGLKSSKFLLANGEGDALVILYTPSGWDIKVENPGIAADKSDNGGLFQLTELDTHYLIPVFNFDGNRRTFWAGKQSVNAQPTGNVIFGLDGDNAQHGQDGANLAVWDVAYEEGKGFTFHCVGRDIYISHANGAACPSETAVYWKAYTEWALAYDVAGVEAAGTAVANALKASDAKTTFDAAKLAYETDKTAEGAIDKYAAAINAAIDVVNACDVVKAAFAGYKLSTLGTAAVKEVETKYNAGEYKDVAEVSAAYVAAVKTQNAVGSDFTGAIVNPSFELGNANGWTYEASDDHGAKENSNGTYTMSNNDGKYVFNIWSKGNAISQTIEGLPNGTYKLQAVIATDGGQKVQLNANDKNVQIDATDKGTGVEGEVEFEVTDGKATIGAEGVNKYWYKVDNFRLTLVNPANATVPEKDAWYTGADFFRFRADKNATEGSPYFAWKDKVEPVWGADADDVSNGCIVCNVPANVNPQSQIWIRGTEAGKTVANGSKDGFRVTFRVKADGEYTLESQAHNNWGYKTGGNPFGPLNVTTEWQTVSFVCTGEKAKNDFTDLCFNLSGDAERTFYFDDVQIVRGSEWYLNNEFHAKDYKEGTETYADGNDPHPAARFVADEEGGYVEVISNAGAGQTYNSQLWIAIPQEFVGTMTKMTMEVQATKAITCPESFQATATGNGWGCNPGPGKGVEFKVGEWTTIERVLNTKNVKSTGTWKNLQADQYCLDLSEASGDKEAITYKFRNVKFEQAYEDWYSANPVYAKDYTKGTETYENGTTFPKAPYVFGSGDEGGYIEVVSNADAENDYGSQIFFEIPEELRGKNVLVRMKVKASQEIKVATALHSSADGNGWSGNPAGDQVSFTVDKWVDIERTFNTDCKDSKGNPIAYYVMNLSDNKGKAAIKYDFDEVSFKEYVDWGDLVEATADGTLIAEKDWTKETSYSGWSGGLPDGYTRSVDNGLVLENTSDEGDPWSAQFEVINGLSNLKAGAKYSIRLTMKIQGEGDLQVNFGDWGTTQQYLQTLENGYRQVVWEYPSWASDVASGVHALFQGRKFKGTIILEKVEVFEDYLDPATLNWTDNLFTNGDVEGEDMSSFIAKVNDDEDALLLPAATKVFKESNQVMVKTAAREKDPADETKYLGNDHDTQFFVRLPYALKKGNKYFFSVDYISNKVADVQSQTHAEPGEWKSNNGVGKITTGSTSQTLEGYFTADNDMRTIAFNLASATEGGTFYFDNFVFKVVVEEEADIKAFTQTWDETSKWNETLALNVAYDNGRNAETEGCTEESVKALTDAMAAGKAILQPAEGAEPATKDAIAAAAKAIEDAIAGLTKGGAEELLPKPELGADFIEIAQDQGKSLDEFTRTDLVEGEDYNTYTAHGDLNIALKMMPVDVEGCDYVVVYFATPAPEGWKLAFWNNQDLVDVPAGATEFKYVFAEDPKCDVKDGVLPQICMMTFFGAPNPLEAKIYGIYKHKVPVELAYTDLTKEMFFHWNAADETAEALEASNCDYNIGTSTGQPYGLSTVNHDRFADLSAYSTIELTATEGEPRLLFNRIENEGTVFAEVPRDKDKYETVVDNGDGSKTYVIDIAAIVAEYGFAHLHAIKGANWANTTVTEIKLGYAGEKPALPIPTAIEGVETEGESIADGKYIENGQIVIVKGGKKYTAAGVEIK